MSNIKKIPEFDPNLLIQRPGACTFVGGSHSGKSSTCARILRDIHTSFHFIFIYSPQQSTSDEWMLWLETLAKATRVIEVHDLDRSLAKIEEAHKKHPELKTLLLVDDFIGGLVHEDRKELQYKKGVLKHVFYRSRHSNLWSFFLLQDVCSLSARFLQNSLCNFIFVDYSEVTMRDHLYPKLLAPTRKTIKNLGIDPKGSQRVLWIELYLDLLDDLAYLGCLCVFKDSKNKIGLYKYEQHEFLKDRGY